MDSLSSIPFLTRLADRVEAVLVASVERLTSVRSGIFWTLSYVILLALMYLFHSPFRAQVNTRTDWYAQVTKGLQIWFAVVHLCFHVGPHLYVSKSDHAKNSKPATMAQRMFVEDTVASIFFPIFCFSSFFFLILHKFKRRYKLAFTYGPSLTLILINSVLLSIFATMHYTVCEELFSTVVPAEEVSSSLSKVGAATLDHVSRIICPRPAVEAPFQCITFLSAICVFFVFVDYVYKSRRGDGNPSRGILWAELYPHKPQAKANLIGMSGGGTITASQVLYSWHALRAREEHSDLSAQLYLREGDPRLTESRLKAIRLNHAHGIDGIETSSSEGWRDENDKLCVEAEKYIFQPTNRPGMVPWFSTFIFNTTWQTIARLALDFLTFDVRLLQKLAAPKVFDLHFGKSLESLPRLFLPSTTQNGKMEKEETKRAKGWEELSRLNTDASTLGSPKEIRPSRNAAEKTPQKSPSVTPVKGQVEKKKNTSTSTALPSPSETAAASTIAPDGESDEKPDVWFDWIADVGDGFNSTYSMARLIAQPFLKLPWHRSSDLLTGKPKRRNQGDVTPSDTAPSEETSQYLPRGSFMVVGGDLAYPSPDDETYTTRLFMPYRDALGDNVHLKNNYRAAHSQVVVPDAHDKDAVRIHLLDAMTVSKMASGCDGLQHGKVSTEEALRSIPLLFAIPGNHDWFDGLGTYTKYILEKTWIGGWLMPQKSSYFVLRLPYNWFMLCLDTGCEQDIDASQRNYFLDVVEKYMDEQSCVILAIHEPDWIYNSMLKSDKLMQPETSKICDALGTRLRIQLAGDIHNYSRHVPSDTSTEAPMLVVSGGGGAFMHGPRLTPVVAHCTAYRRACAFPASTTFGTLLSRLLGFRVVNWKFDLIIGVCCFMVVVSLLPQSIKHNHRGSSPAMLATLPDAARVWWERTCMYIVVLFSRGIMSVGATLLFFIAFTAAGTEKNAALWKRGLHATVWTSITVLICCGMLSFLLCTMEHMVDNQLLVSSKTHWGSAVEDQVRLTVDSLLNHTQELLGGAEKSHLASKIRRMQSALYGHALVNWLGIVLRCLDPLEMLSYLSEKVSADQMGSFVADASRVDEILYYLYFLLFYWILVTPLVSFVIGSYLLCSLTLFDCMYDATYSAFQIEEFKNFVRFKIDATTRELHAYVVAMRYVPRTWNWDAAYQEELKSDASTTAPPHLRAHPSRWNGKPFRAGAVQTSNTKDGKTMTGNEDGAEILEHFVCSPHHVSNDAS